MDINDFFNLNKPLKKNIIKRPERLAPGPTHDKENEKQINKSRASTSGYDYVKEFTKAEEERILKATEKIGDFDQVSVVTESTVTNNDARSTQEMDNNFYRTYNRPHKLVDGLTINYSKEHIIQMIETNPIVIIQGPTGCGKTTQVPQFILDNAFKKKEHCNIIVTQPRRIAAISIAKRVAAERDWPIGTLVGYKVGMLNHISNDTRLTYCTNGVLLRHLINIKHLLDYTHIILDEVHERGQEMDFLLLIIRKLLWLNSRNVKIILMSATINSDKFAKYFSSPNCGQFHPAPVIDMSQKPHYKINKYYVDQLDSLGRCPEVLIDEPQVNNSMLKYCTRLLFTFDEIDRQECKNNTNSDNFTRHAVLVFLPGIWEIETMNSVLAECKGTKWDVIVLHSTVTNEEQQKVFERPPEGHRRIILSTNIAESSITVPNVKYVIDFCLTKVLVSDSQNFHCLQLTWASKANCEQRAGRTGRVMDGRVYRLVPKEMYDTAFNDHSTPEILRTPLERLVLNVKMLNMGEPREILALALDPPNIMNLENTILFLKEAGALLNSSDFTNVYDGELTYLGKIMATLPVDINISKLIIFGHVFGILRDTVIIGACMSTKNMFNTSHENSEMVYNAKLMWANDTWSDLYVYLNVYKMWITEKNNRNINSKQSEKNWARRHCIQLKSLYEIQALVTDITMRLSHMNIAIPMGCDDTNSISQFEQSFILRVIMAGAFYPNYFVSKSRTDVVDDKDKVKILGNYNPMTTIYLQGWKSSQNGLLYAKRIQDLFKKCARDSVRRIRINFDGSSRIYVTFPSNNNITNDEGITNNTNLNAKIPRSLYKALHLRNSRDEISISILTDEEGKKLAKEYNLPENYTTLQNGTMNLNMKEAFILRPKLPSIDTSCVQIRITYIIDPSHFWAIYNDPDTIQTLNRIQMCVNDLSLTSRINSKLSIGSFVLTPYRMRNRLQYYRGVIKNYHKVRNEEIAVIFLIDIGQRTESRLSELRKFKTPNHAENIPALAVECMLANIKPSVLRNLDSQWIPESLNAFKKLIGGSELYGTIYSVVNNVIAINLICVRGHKKINVNEHLIEQGYAIEKVEGYQSRNNNEIRQNYQNFTAEQLKYYEELQYDQEYLTEFYPEPPEILECKRDIKLRGPHSPLEVELRHLSSATSGKSIIIDKTSINSILLDASPEDNQPCFIVASDIHRNIKNSHLLLRNTTLMPKISGLSSLLSLMFAPRIELRCNKLGNRYISALCGLGSHSITKEAIFPEHDMEVKFDVLINNTDLFDINKLRYYISTALKPSEDEIDDHEVSGHQQQCREALMKIFQKYRKPQDTEEIAYHGQWGIWNENELLCPKKISLLVNDIYPFHFAMPLKDVSSEFEDMLTHLSRLKKLATEDERKHNYEIKCELCLKTVFGLYDLRIHLANPQHIENELELQQNGLK